MKNPLTEKYDRWFKRNAIGEQKESEGKFEDAIHMYEANVYEGAHTLFPYERLAILYKRKNDVKNESRVITTAIKQLRRRSARKPLDKYLYNLLLNFQRRLEELSGKPINYDLTRSFSMKKVMPY